MFSTCAMDTFLHHNKYHYFLSANLQGFYQNIYQNVQNYSFRTCSETGNNIYHIVRQNDHLKKYILIRTLLKIYTITHQIAHIFQNFLGGEYFYIQIKFFRNVLKQTLIKIYIKTHQLAPFF